MFIDQQACDAFWHAYLAQLSAEHRHHSMRADAFVFGSTPASADELAALAVAGRKRATTSLPIEFTALGQSLPRVGDVSIVARGDGEPVAIIERTAVEARAFDDVDEAYAQIEGEGDGTVEYWRDVHLEYFNWVCQRFGGSFDGRATVLCQVFRVVWPK